MLWYNYLIVDSIVKEERKKNGKTLYMKGSKLLYVFKSFLFVWCLFKHLSKLVLIDFLMFVNNDVSIDLKNWENKQEGKGGQMPPLSPMAKCLNKLINSLKNKNNNNSSSCVQSATAKTG